MNKDIISYGLGYKNNGNKIENGIMYIWDLTKFAYSFRKDPGNVEFRLQRSIVNFIKKQ